ncbi:flagellar hook-basal body complex protein FliE [Roseateles sp. YR242]|uniref:flagellar hook-basal body complex protein FliE n=1 Tax=Roseateles sp. YR242 TaxID=1855305 RepID=UPI0008CD8F9A|nr:flagellar hook-basal body complex protein FliE [Roseateles sp. YR242]SEK93134.1 flagellar hook-basal body complex protein FliE [Roseateles sp. YR242]
MSTTFIPPIAALQEPSLAPALRVDAMGGAAAVTSFGNMVTSGLQQVNAQLQASQADLQSLAAGNLDNIHQVMLRLEESRMSFQLMLQVRSRVLESYQDLMRMQV